MKIFAALGLIIFAGAIWGFSPVIMEMRNCYTSSEASSDEIMFHSKAYGWNNRRLCEAKFEIISSLSECVQKAKSSKPKLFMQYAEVYVDRIFKFIHPYEKDYSQIKLEYNDECSDYPSIMIN